MTGIQQTVQTLWWLLQKDLRREIRTPQIVPNMLLTGMVLAVLLNMLPALSDEAKRELTGALLWLAIFFAGTVALDRSFSTEREGGCWQTLMMYPVPPSIVFLAKMVESLIALALLEAILVPAFIVLSDVPLLEHPGHFGLVLALGSVGIAAVGTLISALTSGVSRRGGMLVLVLLPLIIPVLLGAAEATRLLVTAGADDQWWRWMQLLGAFAVLHTTLGALVFEFVIED